MNETMFENLIKVFNQSTHTDIKHRLFINKEQTVFGYVPKGGFDLRIYIIKDETTLLGVSINFHHGVEVEGNERYQIPARLTNPGPDILTALFNRHFGLEFKKDNIPYYNDKFYSLMVGVITKTVECYADTFHEIDKFYLDNKL